MAQKAPGKSHRKGISPKKLFQMFPDDAISENPIAPDGLPSGARS